MSADGLELSSRGCGLAGIFASGRAGALPRRKQTEPGGDCKTDAGRESIDGEIFKPRMSSRRPELEEFKNSDHQNRNAGRKQPLARIGQPERQSDQEKSERVLAILAEIGMRAVLRRS